jgi:hypothetical protein
MKLTNSVRLFIEVSEAALKTKDLAFKVSSEWQVIEEVREGLPHI